MRILLGSFFPLLARYVNLSIYLIFLDTRTFLTPAKIICVQSGV